jgi:hypothetical protein
VDAFDLGRLTDFDFELLCKDIFEDLLKVRLEIFSPGRDDGVDLRHMKDGQNAVIVQCKHWSRSGRATLIRHVEKKEAPKVKRLAPDRYILATTAELTKPGKDRLSKALSPYMVSPGDCFGSHDIISILSSRPEIVRRHLRL